LRPTPDPVHAHRGETVHFFFSTPGHELAIDSAVLEDVRHDGGHAWGRVKADAEYGHPYKYNIHDLTTKKTYDPTLIIDP
jgi:hypothetical protein